MFCEHPNSVRSVFGREISGPGGFVPPGTKFDAIPVLRAGEQIKISSDDLYVMRGLFSGEAAGYAKHAGKLKLGDAIATAKDSTKLLRRMAVYEGAIDERIGECERLPVMNDYSLLASKGAAHSGPDAKFYRRFSEMAGRVGALSFPEVQKHDSEALWVLNQAQTYCRDEADRNTLQRLIPKECQPASDIICELNRSPLEEDLLVSDRTKLNNALSRVPAQQKFACEMSLAQLEKKHPGKSARSEKSVWTGLKSERVDGLPNSFLASWVRSTPQGQAHSIASVLPGDDLDIPVGCIRIEHTAFGKPYQSELPFYDSDELKRRAKDEYARAFKDGTMSKLDVVLPKTVTEDDVLPARFSQDEYQENCDRSRRRDNWDLYAAACEIAYHNRSNTRGDEQSL